MIKRTLILFLIILLTACSNLNKKIVVNNSEKILLATQLEELKVDLSKNNTSNLEHFIKPSLKNDYVLSRMKNIDFSRVNMFFSEPIFEGDRAANIVAFNAENTTLYLDFEYEFKDDIWQIIDMKERRR